MRENFYLYYRLHAWKAYYRNLDDMAMWKYIPDPGEDVGLQLRRLLRRGLLFIAHMRN